MELEYCLALRDLQQHRLDVGLRIRGLIGDHVVLSMAAWSPGLYEMRDHARHLRQLRAHDAEGRSLSVVKTDKHHWRVSLGGAEHHDGPSVARQVNVEYSVYSRDPSLYSNHVDDEHALLHGPATYLMVEGARDARCRVRLELPAGCDWPVVTGLQPDGDGFVAEGLDELLDCPIHVGPCEIRSFQVHTTEIRLAVWGRFERAEVADIDRLVHDLEGVARWQAGRFGDELPCRQYTFILLLTHVTFGGFENRNSSTNIYTPYAFESHARYSDLLELLSHELFHVWNGKRIVPAGLHRIDYTRPAYTRCLWLMEGFTRYYDRYTLLRTGVVSLEQYLTRLAHDWLRLRPRPGRLLQSLEDASHNVWLDQAWRDESSINTTVSYYLVGSQVALVLDLTIRRETAGQRSLDDVMALLWNEYGRTGTGYPEDPQALLERSTGLALERFFDQHIRGYHNVDLAGALSWLGLSFVATPDGSSAADARGPSAWLGLVVTGNEHRVLSVVDGGPGALAGISPGDELLAIDGRRIDSTQTIRDVLRERQVGDRVELTGFRGQRLRVYAVVLAGSPPTRVTITAPPDPGAARVALFTAWSGASRPDADWSLSVESSRSWV